MTAGSVHGRYHSFLNYIPLILGDIFIWLVSFNFIWVGWRLVFYSIGLLYSVIGLTVIYILNAIIEIEINLK
jgi:hypothetical protein